MNEFPLEPVDVAKVETAWRRIQTPIPVPQSVELLQRLREFEARSARTQPPIVWHHGKGATISDPYGNQWIDFTSGVLVTNSGHGRSKIVRAIQDQAGQGLYHAFGFPTEIRAQLIDALAEIMPAPLERIFLLTTGAEATEFCMKLARTQAIHSGADGKNVIVTFDNAFHGRTMGAQLAGGTPSAKTWLGEPDPRFAQVPFPDGFRQPDVSFDVFENSLAARGINPDDVCGVMTETYQGCNACLMPAEYAQALREWCRRFEVVLIFDEVQAGFGRTGTWFGFEHLDVDPDLVACGKGMTGGLPLSCVLGREELMSLYGPGETTHTHGGNPISCAAALANLDLIRDEGLVANAAALEPLLAEGCRRIAAAARGRVGRWDAVGLVGCVQFTKSGTTEPDPAPARELVRRAVQRGVMLFAPVGVGGCAIKIDPPLCITREALEEGLGVLETVAGELA